jgi:hypothetical protein
MILEQIRSLIQFKLGDMAGKFDRNALDVLMNDALRDMAVETLLLEGKDSSLTYSSGNDGFTVPSDFIKVKSLHWLDPTSSPVAIPQVSVETIYKMRRDWLLINEDAGTYLTPLGYAIHNDTIILDSTTQTSPVLYYYKNHALLTLDTETPSFAREYHYAIADYVLWKVRDDEPARRRYRDALEKMNARKFKQGKTGRVRYVGL